MLTDETLLERVDAFLEASKMKPTRFGIEVLADGGLVKGLREGRSLSIRNANKVLDFIETYQACDAQTAASPKAVRAPLQSVGAA